MVNIRKTVAAVLALLLLIASCPTGKAVQALSGRVVANPGSTVSVTVSLSQPAVLAGFKIFLDYDTSCFSLAPAGEGYQLEQGSFSSSGTLLGSPTETGCQVLWYSINDLTAEGDLFTMTLNTAATAPSGDYPVTMRVSAPDTVKVDGTQVSLVLDPVTISVTAAGTSLIYVGDVTSRAGKTVSVPVSIESNQGFAGFSFCATGADGLTMTGVESGSLLSQLSSGALTVNAAEGRVNWTAPTVISDDGQLLLLSWSIDSDCALGDYPISLALIDDNGSNFVDDRSAPLAVRFFPGKITVVDFILGDVNDDGYITPFDLVCIAKHIVGLELLTGVQLQAADIDGDGGITSADCVRLARFLVELISSL